MPAPFHVLEVVVAVSGYSGCVMVITIAVITATRIQATATVSVSFDLTALCSYHARCISRFVVFFLFKVGCQGTSSLHLIALFLAVRESKESENNRMPG